MRKLLYIMGAFALGVSCARVPEQRSVEYRSIQHARDLFQTHSVLRSNEVPTNLQDIYKGAFDRAYPHGWHKDFKKYGKYAGFKNSFFEKYVLFPPGTTSQIAQGELVMMNSHPFPLDKHKLGRFVVLKQGNSISPVDFSEEVIQKILREERIKPYDLPAFPPPPRESRTRFPGEPPEWVYQLNLFCDRIAERLGMGLGRGWILQFSAIGFFILLTVATCFLYRQARRR